MYSSRMQNYASENAASITLREITIIGGGGFTNTPHRQRKGSMM